jgi:Flp pilus assembly protein TadG
MTSLLRLLARIRREDDGQAMIYVAIVVGALVTVLYTTYDLGRLVAAKVMSQNGADAAALASVSLKVSVHHTRTLAYLAMTDQAVLARREILAGIGSLSKFNGAIPPAPAPGAPPGPAPAKPTHAEFEDHMKRADSHMDRYNRLRHGLRAYNAWIEEEGPRLAAEAARIAYAANVTGMNDHSATGRAVDERNMRLLADPGAFVENGGMGSSKFIGGMNFANEGAGKRGVSGKSFVWVKPQVQPLSRGKEPLELWAWAAAGPVPSVTIQGADPREQGLSFKVPVLGEFGIPWYSPRLMRTGKLPDGTDMQGLESQH